jgi:hypothetical protein
MASLCLVFFCFEKSLNLWITTGRSCTLIWQRSQNHFTHLWVYVLYPNLMKLVSMSKEDQHTLYLSQLNLGLNYGGSRRTHAMRAVPVRAASAYVRRYHISHTVPENCRIPVELQLAYGPSMDVLRYSTPSLQGTPCVLLHGDFVIPTGRWYDVVRFGFDQC